MRRSFFDGPSAREVGLLPNCKAAGRRAGPCRGGVVLRRPQNLVPSSSSTTSLGPKAPPTYRTWCSASRNPLFFRRQAPRLPSSRRRRSAGRGAPLPANPCSFVVKHHVFGAQGAAGVPDVVLRSPQNLVPSSSSTTSSELKALTAYQTWCLTPRKPLFFRRQAPRLWRRMSRPPASHPKVMHEPLFSVPCINSIFHVDA